MICPKCGSLNMSKVLDSRDDEKKRVTKRRRECTVCGCRYITHEQVIRIYKRRNRGNG